MNDGRTFALASPERTAAVSSSLQERVIDWSVCFSCGVQEPKSVVLIKPYARRDFLASNPETHGTYKSFPPNLMQAYKINVLSPALKSKVERIISKSSATPEESLQWAFVENKAVFHKKCLIKYDEGHLKRLLEKESPEHETVSPKKTRRSFSATNFLDNCFFCNSEEGIL